MKKLYKCFAVSELFPIFAPAILEKTGGNALFDILHDRLTSFDLVKSGKFNPIEVKSSLVKPVLYPDEGRGQSYYICDFGYFQNLTRQVCREDVPFSSCRKNVKLNNYKKIMLKKTTALLAEIAKLFIHIDPAPTGGKGLKNDVKALKEDLQDISKKESSTKKIVNEREERI